MKHNNTLKVFIIVFVIISLIAIPAYAGGPIRVNVDDLDLSDYRGQDGTVLSMEVTGTTDGNAWGTGIYSDDSDIPHAAVHAGVVKLGETKRIEITILPGQSSYKGTLKNGIESYDYSEWEGSFKFNDSQATNPQTPQDPEIPQHSAPKQPLFYMEDKFKLLDGDEGQVTFRLDRQQIIGEYTGFKLYFTNNDGKPEIFEFSDDAFSYSEKLGKTVDISVTTVNGTVESTPQKLKFAMLDRIVGKIWSERQTDDLLGSPCWYGLSWEPVKGATQYSVYVTKDIRNYSNFQNYRELEGFSNIIVTDTFFNTKVATDLPADIVNATWGESRYVVVFPMNEDGLIGPFPRYYNIPMTGN